MVKCKINSGFVYVTNYSYKFRELIQTIAERAEQAIPSKKLLNKGFSGLNRPEVKKTLYSNLIVNDCCR